MDFPTAFKQCRKGQRIARTSWDTPGLAVERVPAGGYVVSGPHIAERDWTPTRYDLDAEDWELVR